MTVPHNMFVDRSFCPASLREGDQCHIHDLQVGDTSVDMSDMPMDLLMGPDGFVYVCLGERGDVIRTLSMAQELDQTKETG